LSIPSNVEKSYDTVDVADGMKSRKEVVRLWMGKGSALFIGEDS
jgi:hypothetical protein